MNTILTRLSAELIEQYEADGFWHGDTIYSLARWHMQRAPEAFAVRDRFRRVSYRQLIEDAGRIGFSTCRARPTVSSCRNTAPKRSGICKSRSAFKNYC